MKDQVIPPILRLDGIQYSSMTIEIENIKLITMKSLRFGVPLFLTTSCL